MAGSAAPAPHPKRRCHADVPGPADAAGLRRSRRATGQWLLGGAAVPDGAELGRGNSVHGRLRHVARRPWRTAAGDRCTRSHARRASGHRRSSCPVCVASQRHQQHERPSPRLHATVQRRARAKRGRCARRTCGAVVGQVRCVDAVVPTYVWAWLRLSPPLLPRVCAHGRWTTPTPYQARSCLEWPDCLRRRRDFLRGVVRQ